ncbi:MAG: dnaN [Candidatus Berkelbacteria bacterium Gr01-1014_85]|uniref:Beta sliding clamp n=1 Tax=Candidatus Berkelbacteria bacterium Gr01-1014_85 TaxID=2017150 RepID=A0A554JE11_9BACT|nr:MAG: dnaN [Candidatus Berkelbacteria bacterium Gr01-1014_85]
MSKTPSLKLDRSSLLKAINLTSRLASNRPALPALSFLLFEAVDSKLIIYATNLEQSTKVELEAQIEANYRFTLPGRLFNEYLNSINSIELELRLINPTTIECLTENGRVEFRGLDPDEYPQPSFTQDKPLLSLPASEWKQAFSLVVYATALDDTRPTLAGVFILVSNDELVIAATDSYRLAEKIIKLKTPLKLSNPQKLIIPKESISELVRLLSDQSGDTSVFVGDNSIEWQVDGLRFSSRLIDGNYPDYRAIIPTEHQTRLTVNTADCLAALKTTQLFAREVGNTVKLTAEPDNGLTIESVADQRGQALQKLTAITEGQPMQASFNVKYLLDALSVMSADNLFFENQAADRPLVIRETNLTGYLALVMPLRLD